MTHTVALLHKPSPALGACMMAGVERDTRGCMLDDAERFNYYPATPMAVISWIFEGELHMVEVQDSNSQPTLGPPLPQIVFSGPRQRPSVSWSSGEVHALSVGFYPDAMSRLMDRPIEPYLNQTLPLDQIAPPSLLMACQAILNVGNDAPFAMLEAQFQRLWHGPNHASPMPYLSIWVRSLATRAAHSPTGRSLRQMQRRIRSWTGQSYRDLQLFTRIEQAFIHRIEAHDDTAPNLAAIAADAGFADQSHMGREIRRVTGLSPASFGDRLADDEAFWYYRLIAGELQRQPVTTAS